MERVVIVAHRRFNRANASLSVWRSQGKRERERERISRIASPLRIPNCTKCIHDTFVSCLPMRRHFHGTVRARNEISPTIRQISYVRISASKESLKVQLRIRVWRDSWEMRIPSSTNFQNASLTRLRIRATFVFPCGHNFNVRAVGLYSLKLNQWKYRRLKQW